MEENKTQMICICKLITNPCIEILELENPCHESISQKRAKMGVSTLFPYLVGHLRLSEHVRSFPIVNLRSTTSFAYFKAVSSKNLVEPNFGLLALCAWMGHTTTELR